MFDKEDVNLQILKDRAYNLRWATVPQGVIPLTAADPDFPCAPEITEAICRFASDRYFSYGHAEGMSEFKESVAGYFQDKRGISADPAKVLAIDSASFGIYLTCKAFLPPGSEAIIFDPVDFLFRYSVESLGGVAVPFAIPPGTDDLDIDRMEGLITGKTRMICLCNPLNPTGKVFTANELMQIGELACKYDLTILSDEIWSDIIFTPHVYTSMASLNAEIAARTITVTGFSKSYGLAGLRIGAVMAQTQENYSKLFEASLHGSTVHGVNLLGQVAATAALNHCGYWLEKFKNHLQQMRTICVSGLNAVPGFSCIAPEGCYVAFANITETGKTSQEIRDILFNDAKVSVVPGLKQWFGDGANGYIRLSFATSGELLGEALQRIKRTIEGL